MKSQYSNTGIAAVALLFAGSVFAQSVTVDAPWVRGTVIGQKATGAFMDLTSNADVTLVAVTTPLSASVEIHETRIEDEVMRMRPISRLKLTAGKTVQLKPGSYHVMLMDLKQVLKKGDVVPLILRIESADGKMQTLEVKAEVRDLAARQ
jgi:copper(I)-binding protein